MLVVLFLVNSIQVSDAQSWQEYLEQLSEQEEYEEIIAIKPMFLVMDYK